ncbi:TPA: hypothetical protein ACH3X2_000790 [Trebouxia sp. C0005]
MGAEHSKPSPKADIDNAQRRMAQERGLDLTKWNWAVLGQTKAGKSSMINAIQGKKDSDSGAAKVGIINVTEDRQKYALKTNEHCIIWDMLSFGRHGPVETDFHDRMLYAFDGLLLMSAHTFSEPDLMVIKRAQEYNIPVALVRTMSDVHIGNLMHSEELSMDEAERKLRKEARTNMALNLDRAGLNHMYPEFFIVSSRVLYCHIVGKTLQSGWVEMDEQSLLEWLCRELKKRETT